MASRHHHSCIRRQNHHVNIPPVATSSRGDSTHLSPDNLLHLVASYLQTQRQETQSPDQTCSCKAPCRRSNGGFHQHQKKTNVQPREHDDHVILSCLLRKVDDLESSLNEFAARYDQRRDRYSTLRDSAARVIQTRFRSFLVRRSVSLRHLKELALIKSSFVSLKSSVSGKTHFLFKVVFRKATDLLLQLDSIQGRIDPMIRSSKRSLSRDLVRFLQYIDDCAVRRYGSVVGSQFKFRGCDGKMGKVFVSNGELEELDSMSDESSYKFVKGNVVKAKPVVSDKDRNVCDVTSSEENNDSVVVMSRDNERKRGSKTRNMVLVEGSGGETVSFDENGNVYKVYGDTSESSISEEDDSVSGSKDGNGDEKENRNEVEGIKNVSKEEEESGCENEVSSSEGSEGDAIVTRNGNEHEKKIQLQKGSLMFSPPLPLKMEP
ncbi:unnamed protein product [Brassica rapa]|uniref:BAG domain-containing protein n=2 Tax=Brassica TaxID=3705 RepID=A0A3P5YL37_BRACM|nr:unnamed protein product [Brassica napus]CAG7872525.1 unnamed protein product [Brassica rapa]VDC68372.1 unnamed protein product [Brassica rapa]